jgi:hypothetical protein
MRSSLLSLIALAALAAAPPPIKVLDQGSYTLYQADRPLGAESFLFEVHGDSLLFVSDSYLTLRSAQGNSRLEHHVQAVLSSLDQDVRTYTSATTVGGRTLRRLVMPGDTTVMIVREDEQGGEGIAYFRPAGRLFILENATFAMFDLAVRNLARTPFEVRPISLVIMGAADTVLAAEIKRVGKEPVRWAGRLVQAEHFQIADPSAVFDVWMHPEGRMIRLVSPTFDLRVEREPQAPKPKPTPKGSRP